MLSITDKLTVINHVRALFMAGRSAISFGYTGFNKLKRLTHLKNDIIPIRIIMYNNL